MLTSNFLKKSSLKEPTPPKEPYKPPVKSNSLSKPGVNEHAIELEKGKQPPYKPIFSLGPVEYKIFKTYIGINLPNGFIRVSKSLAGALILFVHKPDNSLLFDVN